MGDPVPFWVESLETQIFGTPWGPLGNHEHLLLIAPQAFIRWSVIPAAGEAELIRIAVAPEARRQGLARRLMETSEAFLQKEGLETMYLEVRISNASARALYEAMDWKLQRMRKAYYRDGEDAALYWKQLSI
jgi:ribosomal-protein-alanine N-acetyltransferase